MSDSKDKNPLEDTFELPEVETDELEDDIFELEIPENPEIKDIVQFALNAYSDQIKDIQHMEPKYRARALEVAQMYLKLAQDAILKTEDQNIKKGKAKDEPEQEPEKKLTRREILQESKIKKNN